jgi:hypothetical protein
MRGVARLLAHALPTGPLRGPTITLICAALALLPANDSRSTSIFLIREPSFFSASSRNGLA